MAKRAKLYWTGQFYLLILGQYHVKTRVLKTKETFWLVFNVFNAHEVRTCGVEFCFSGTLSPPTNVNVANLIVSSNLATGVAVMTHKAAVLFELKGWRKRCLSTACFFAV